MPERRGIIERYRQFLPVAEGTPVCTLVEGDTPLIPAPRLGKRLGVELYLKCEGFNPTGSFKDRGMTLAISKAVENGARAVICASTGNTSASAAAYAARAGLASVVLIPEGKIALGKLAQALAHGSRVVAVSANFDRALSIVRELARRNRITLVNSLNPFRLEGQKTGAFELCDVLGEAPDYLAIPVGNAGNITAYWMGFREYREAGLVRKLPKLLGFQAAGAAPLVLGRVVENPDTVATAIRIGNPARWREAEAAIRDSGGMVRAVTDEEILDAYRLVASEEGIFVEPASAASIAGLRSMASEGALPGGGLVVAVLTGHGLKDPDTAVRMAGRIEHVEPEIEAVESLLVAEGVA